MKNKPKFKVFNYSMMVLTKNYKWVVYKINLHIYLYKYSFFLIIPYFIKPSGLKESYRKMLKDIEDQIILERD